MRRSNPNPHEILRVAARDHQFSFVAFIDRSVLFLLILLLNWLRREEPAMKTHQSSRLSGSFFLFGSVLCWGTIPVLLRSLTGSIDAWTANGLRYPLAAMLYWPVLVYAFHSGHLTRSVVARCLVPAVLTLIGQVFWALAPYYLPASSIGFFIRASLVWSLLGAMILFPDERPLLASYRFWIGIVLSVVGFVVLSASKLRFDADVSGVGITIILICGIFFGLYAVSVRSCLRGVNPLVAFGVVSQFVSAGTLTAMFVAGRYEAVWSLDGRGWSAVIGSSLLGIALGHAFLYSAIRRLGAAITSGSLTLTPFVTAVLASAFLNESMSVLAWSAGTTMVIGALFMLTAQNRISSQWETVDRET